MEACGSVKKLVPKLANPNPPPTKKISKPSNPQPTTTKTKSLKPEIAHCHHNLNPTRPTPLREGGVGVGDDGDDDGGGGGMD